MSIYEEKGYSSREDYLKSVAEEYDVPTEIVCTLAESLGSSEDFDGLLSILDDYADNI